MLLPPPLFAEEQAGELTGILSRQELVVAVYKGDTPGFFSSSEPEPVGLDASIALDIAKRLGVSLRFRRDASTYDDVARQVANRDADIAISTLSDSLERAKFVRFTQPYVTLRQALLINRLRAAQMKVGQEPVRILATPGIRLGVIAGTSYVDFAHADYPLATIIEYTDPNSLFDDVRSGSLLAMLYDEIEIREFHKLNPDAALSLQTHLRSDRNDTIAIAVHPNDQHLLDWLNLYIQKIESDGTLEAWRKKHIENRGD